MNSVDRQIKRIARVFGKDKPPEVKENVSVQSGDDASFFVKTMNQVRR